MPCGGRSSTRELICAIPNSGNNLLLNVASLLRLPAIATVADVYSPICMLVACSILFLLKPILLELGSAMRIDGANVSAGL
jgi:hypothetical protein